MRCPRRFLDNRHTRQAGFGSPFLLFCRLLGRSFPTSESKHGSINSSASRACFGLLVALNEGWRFSPAPVLIERTTLHWLTASAVLRRTHHEHIPTHPSSSLA